MPGLSGVVGRSLSHRDPQQLIKTLKNVGAVDGMVYEYRSFCSDGALILNSLTGLLPKSLCQPAYDVTGNLVLFLEGEIYNLDELVTRVSLAHDASVCDVLLELYMAYGEDFVGMLNGEFTIAIYSKADDRLLILSDHMASMPMYFLEQNGTLFFGSEKKFILALVARCPKIDPIGLLQIIAHRYNVDDRTFLEGVKRMMPGSKLVFHHGRLEENRYYQLNFMVPNRVSPVSDLAMRWGDQLRDATSRRLRDKDRILISLSAGLDSRAVACAIPRNHRPVASRTRGVGNSLEMRYASEIAKQLDFFHIQEEPGSFPYSSMIPRIVWRTECETHFMNAVSIAGHRTIKENADHIAGGWVGDASSGGHLSVDLMLQSRRKNFVECAFGRHLIYGKDKLEKVFAKQFVKAHFPGVREAFHQSFKWLEGETNLQKYEVWDLYQRQRRQTTSSMLIDSYLFEKIRPFYDKEYLEFTLTLPVRLRFGQSLYQSMIYDIGPEIRHIPRASNQLRLHSSIAGNLTNKVVTLAHRAATRQIRRVNPGFKNRIEQHPKEDLAAAIRQDQSFRILIERFLESEIFDSSVFNRQGISRLLNEHYASNYNHADLLGYVATMAVGLPYFLNGTSRCPEEAQPLAEYS